MATKEGGDFLLTVIHLENISATGSQIPPYFCNNCSYEGFFVVVVVAGSVTLILTLSFWVGGWLKGGAERLTPVTGCSDQKLTEVRERRHCDL